MIPLILILTGFAIIGYSLHKHAGMIREWQNDMFHQTTIIN